MAQRILTSGEVRLAVSGFKPAVGGVGSCPCTGRIGDS